MTTTRYDLIDSRTSQVVGSFQSRNRAYAAADRRDNAFGAVRFIVRPIWSEAA